jgi:hypothetical protein
MKPTDKNSKIKSVGLFLSVGAFSKSAVNFAQRMDETNG